MNFKELLGATWPWRLLFAGLLLGLTWLVYLPGLSGSFLFDDYGSLPPLGDYGPIHHFWQVVAWITSGFAGPTGRPVALASFLIDARNWPAPPEVFKQTNVWIHLINGVLLAGLSTAVARGLGVVRQRAVWVGVLAAGVWLLHPFWVSTTLYVIQRMAMLAALFVFAGLWAYVHGRLRLQQGRLRSAYVWMTLGLGLGTLLATFSKENGALLPLLAWLLEAFVFDRDGRALDRHGKGFMRWRRVFVILPSLVVLGYMAWQLPMLFSSQTFGRDFTPGQRLLTESRILWGYLAAIWLPGTHMGGLFNDDIPLSHGLLQPLSTFFAVLGLVLLVVFSWLTRVYARSAFWRAAGLAVAFYLVGHLIESTWLPLELSFEHRNYLPAGLMFLPLGILAVRKWRDQRTIVAWSVVVLLCALAVLTAKRADLWGKPFQQALVWAHEHPKSPRAQGYLASFWRDVGNTPEAIVILDQALSQHPRNLFLTVNRTLVACEVGSIPKGQVESLIQVAGEGRLDRNVTGYQFDKLLQRLRRGCGRLGEAFELKLLDIALTNPNLLSHPQEKRGLLHRRALYWLANDQPERAYRDYLSALELPRLEPGTRLRFAAELGSADQQRLALKLLNAVPSPLSHIHGWSMAAIHQRWLRHVGFYRKSEAHMRRQLEKDLGSKSGSWKLEAGSR